MKKINVGIFIFDEVEVLDFAGPFEVFSRTRLLKGAESRRSDDSADIAKKRFQTYEQSTKPVLEYYKEAGLIKEISGENKNEEIYVKIVDFINFIRG